MATSGTVSFAPSIADFVVEAFSRIQIRGPQLQTEHIIEARRSANLILQDWSGNRSVNLWAVDLIQIPLIPGVAQYRLPGDTIQLLDVYLRSFTENTASTTIGNTLTPVLTGGGLPVISALGDPATLAPGSGTLSATIGSQIMGLHYPAHGLSAGDPIFLTGIISVGAVALSGTLVVDAVIDSDNVVFLSPIAAYETQTLQGATPLLQTTSGSNDVNVIYPHHGLSVGDTFNVWSATTVGGLTLSGDYTVAAATQPYQFTINSGGSLASASTAGFIQSGQISFMQQNTASPYVDIPLYGISRTEYAAIPEKLNQGRPTTFWLDRVAPPVITIWPVPPETPPIYGIAMYRMRQIQDANPILGQTLDMPNRFMPAFSAALTAALAEKFVPESFKEKLLIAESIWTRAAQEDHEDVPLYITPGLTGYFR